MCLILKVKSPLTWQSSRLNLCDYLLQLCGTKKCPRIDHNVRPLLFFSRKAKERRKQTRNNIER